MLKWNIISAALFKCFACCSYFRTLIVVSLLQLLCLTGSLYCDGALRTKGFSGEGVYGSSVIAIKTHTVNPLFTNMEKLPTRVASTTPVFGAAIFLVRNPRNAMIAEWHRERTKRKSNITVSNHFLYVDKSHFGKSVCCSKVCSNLSHCIS